MSETLLELIDLRKSFGGLRAVDGVSFELLRGEILGLIGPNGSGKSTVINLISGFYRPSGGSVRFSGQNISGWPPHQIAALGIGRTFQLLRNFPGLSATANTLLATHLLGSQGLLGAIIGGPMTAPEESRLHERSREAVDFVGLIDRASVPSPELSSGEGRLLELARALAPEPELLLLDEPASGLNTAETALLGEKLKELQAAGKTILLVEHDMRLVMSLAHRLVVLNEGRVLAAGPPQVVQADEKVVEAYLGAGALRRRKARAGGESPATAS
jgi:branched-chain amino acid transport system ATP-binding protein